MKKITVRMLFLLLFGGSVNFAWSQGVSPARFQMDKAGCDYEAEMSTSDAGSSNTQYRKRKHAVIGSILEVIAIAARRSQLSNLCMQAKGYTQGQIDAPQQLTTENSSSAEASDAKYAATGSRRQERTRAVGQDSAEDETSQRVAFSKQLVIGCSAWMATYSMADTAIVYRREINEWGDLSYFQKLEYNKRGNAHPMAPLAIALAQKGGGKVPLMAAVKNELIPEIEKMRLQKTAEYPGKQKQELTVYILPQIKERTEQACQLAGEKGIHFVTLSTIQTRTVDANDSKVKDAVTTEKKEAQLKAAVQAEPKEPLKQEVVQKVGS